MPATDRVKKLAMFNDDDDDDGPAFQSKPLDQNKLTQFTSNTVRKSKREKEAEAAEAKRREEEEQNAKAYAEFVNAFDAPPSSSRGGGGFVRSSASGGEAPRAYNPLGAARSSSRRDEGTSNAPEDSAASTAKPKGKRAMDSFLEEIKREQAEREDRHKRRNVVHASSATAMAAFESQRGSRDTGDPETTNIFVANLPSNVTEATLGHFFARQGPVGSVKIMWPRSDATSGVGADITSSRKSKSAGLSGFVQYMKRRDAEACVRELDGFDWGGSILRVGWSKAVPLAPKALYVRERSGSPDEKKAHRSRRRSRSRSRSSSPRRERDSHRTRDKHDRYSDRDHGRRRVSYSRSRSRSRSPSSHRHRSSRNDERGSRHNHSPSRHHRSRSRSRSRSRRSPVRELDYATRELIRTVAQDIKNLGKEYEENLKEREKNNPKYAFLLRSNAPGYDYFKSLRSDAYLTGDFDDEGSQSVWSTDSADESEKERTVRKEVLGKLAKRRFEALLRRQTGRREDMARAMVFCIDHAHAAPQIADTLISSLLVDGTAVPRKVARLHLICDILHNSAISVHKAWRFRQEFQARLPLVFDHLSTIYQSFPGRMTAEIFKKQILAVVEVWEDWIVFPPEFTQELRTRLDGDAPGDTADKAKVKGALLDPTPAAETAAAVTSKFKASAFKPAAEEVANAADADDIDGAVMDDIDGEPVDGADLDGEPLNGDALDGEPMDGEPLDGEPLDGEPLDGEPFDGEALVEDDLDGELIVTAVAHDAEKDHNDSDVPMEVDDDSD